MADEFSVWLQKQAEQMLDEFVRRRMDAGLTHDQATNEWCERRRVIKTTGRRDPVVDTDCTIVFIPVVNTPFGVGCLGVVYTEKPQWYDQWCAQPGIETYSYWNHSDEPEGVTREDWVARGIAWGTLDSRPLSMQGFAIELVSPHGPLAKSYRDLGENFITVVE